MGTVPDDDGDDDEDEEDRPDDKELLERLVEPYGVSICVGPTCTKLLCEKCMYASCTGYSQQP